MPPIQPGANPATITIHPGPVGSQVQPSRQDPNGMLDVDLYDFDLSPSESMDEVYNKNQSRMTIKIE